MRENVFSHYPIFLDSPQKRTPRYLLRRISANRFFVNFIRPPDRFEAIWSPLRKIHDANSERKATENRRVCSVARSRISLLNRKTNFAIAVGKYNATVTVSHPVGHPPSGAVVNKRISRIRHTSIRSRVGPFSVAVTDRRLKAPGQLSRAHTRATTHASANY